MRIQRVAPSQQRLGLAVVRVVLLGVAACFGVTACQASEPPVSVDEAIADIPAVEADADLTAGMTAEDRAAVVATFVVGDVTGAVALRPGRCSIALRRSGAPASVLSASATGDEPPADGVDGVVAAYLSVLGPPMPVAAGGDGPQVTASCAPRGLLVSVDADSADVVLHGSAVQLPADPDSTTTLVAVATAPTLEALVEAATDSVRPASGP